MPDIVHRVFAPIKAILPESVSRPIRGLFTAILTPAAFAFQTGHFHSSLASKAVDQRGVAIPWYTYPAVDFLRAKSLAKSFAGKSVLEFGAGQSTIWWAQQAANVVSFECDPVWYKYVRVRMPANVSLYLVDKSLTGMEQFIAASACFDVIIVDGLERLTAATKSRDLLCDGGVVIVDNAESDTYREDDGSYAIGDLYRNAGYSRVDFYGFSPANISQHCTSFFFRNRCFLLEGNNNPVRWF